MKQSTRKIVRSLPGPFSYCNCINPCTNLEVEHVIPKSLLVRQIKHRKSQIISINDPNNLYMCCSKINKIKYSYLFGKDFFLSKNNKANGRLARSSLYMKWKYKLYIDEKTLNFWENQNILFPTEDFEIKRTRIIKTFNPVIESYNEKLS